MICVLIRLSVSRIQSFMPGLFILFIDRRWFRFQNMGPSPSARHGLTMTAVREKLYVLGGDNETTRLDDSSLLFILDSTKIKYPTDIPPPVQQTPLPVAQHAPVDTPNNQNNYDTASLEDMSGQQQYYQQQQQQQGGQVPQQPYQQQKNYPDQRQPRLNQTPSSPQQPQRVLTTNTKSGNGLHKEIDTSINYSENNVQPSPTSSSSPNSLTSPRHRSYYPENQNQPLNQVTKGKKKILYVKSLVTIEFFLIASCSTTSTYVNCT